ncbi:hypothetical protein [Vibrio harveyi]|uniref:hypothetical protein n=1 Tax=Vibrio harveyi TaxID=669 RepID=UPI00068171DD|nr:hypothetical protein [Vibrio harveyi]
MNKDKKIVIFAGCMVLAIWGVTWLWLGSKPNEVRGTFGDMFGAANALFSGFAFIGVIYAILMQRTELSLQREELSLTREELKKSANAQEKSEKALAKQAEAMEKSAIINSLTASLESLQRRINSLPLSGDSRMVEANRKQIAELQNKVRAITARLDKLMEESLQEDL